MKITINPSFKHLIMFDFDDTLAKTEECILVRLRENDRIIDHLNGQQEHDDYELDETKYYFDYSEFDTVSSSAKPIGEVIELLKKFLYEKDTKVIVLTARQVTSRDSVRGFLDRQGIDMNKVSVFCSGGSRMKSRYLARLIQRFNIRESVTVFEDNEENIADILRLEYDIPDLTFNAVNVIDPLKIGTDLEEIRKHRYPKGEYGTEEYQVMLKKVHPKMKRRLIGLGSNDYLVKGTKKIKDFKRTKSAPPSA